jgi:predicted site-specific integrase-resolvase
MRTSNPCNFLVSDWEVVQRYKHLGKLKNALEKNEKLEMTKEEKK